MQADLAQGASLSILREQAVFSTVIVLKRGDLSSQHHIKKDSQKMFLLNPTTVHRSPSKNLPRVLTKIPFKPLHMISVKLLSYKAAFLIVTHWHDCISDLAPPQPETSGVFFRTAVSPFS